MINLIKCSHFRRYGIILLLSLVLSLLTRSIVAQADSTWHQKPELSISGFADVFYVYDFNQPQGAERQPFLFNHNRHNEFNLNLGIIKLGVDHEKYRANLAFHTGTYVNDNYAAEPGLLKSIFEANIGLSLNKRNTIWLDAGIMPSHIGFESAISMDNSTLTRSLLAENSPYFMAGAKLTLTPSEKWEIAGLILNGWQRIQRLHGNSLPSIGTQVKFSPSDKILFNWSSFAGTDQPDSTRTMRYFNNFFGQFQITQKIGLITGFDIGVQQRSKGSANYEFWFSPVFIGQYTFNDRWKSAVRAEYYHDQSGVIIQTATANGFQTTGFSLNLDYAPTQNLMCRIEGRWLNSKDPIFETKTNFINTNFIIGASIAIKFSETLMK
jgi:hypothetical protein